MVTKFCNYELQYLITKKWNVYNYNYLLHLKEQFNSFNLIGQSILSDKYKWQKIADHNDNFGKSDNVTFYSFDANFFQNYWKLDKYFNYVLLSMHLELQNYFCFLCETKWAQVIVYRPWDSKSSIRLPC